MLCLRLRRAIAHGGGSSHAEADRRNDTLSASGYDEPSYVEADRRTGRQTVVSLRRSASSYDDPSQRCDGPSYAEANRRRGRSQEAGELNRTSSARASPP